MKLQKGNWSWDRRREKWEVGTSFVFSWMREIAKIAGGRVYLYCEL